MREEVLTQDTHRSANPEPTTDTHETAPESPTGSAGAPVEAPARPFVFKAVLAGVAVDLVLTYLLTAFLAEVALGTRSRDVFEREIRGLPFNLFASVLGLASTFMGGHVAGRLARHAPARHALAAGILSVGVSFLDWGLSPDKSAGPSLLLLIANLLLIVPVAVAGGLTAAQARVPADGPGAGRRE